MKKTFIAFVTFLTVWVCFVSCDKEQESRRISDNGQRRPGQTIEEIQYVKTVLG